MPLNKETKLNFESYLFCFTQAANMTLNWIKHAFTRYSKLFIQLHHRRIPFFVLISFIYFLSFKRFSVGFYCIFSNENIKYNCKVIWQKTWAFYVLETSSKHIFIFDLYFCFVSVFFFFFTFLFHRIYFLKVTLKIYFQTPKDIDTFLNFIISPNK